METNDTPAYMNFPINPMMPNEPYYLKNETDLFKPDSLIAVV